jgi:hypothetical protein
MTRQQAIERWKLIIPTVFVAEDAIKEQWTERLHAAKDMCEQERHDLSDAYVHAIAVEIVSGTTDEELEEIE